MATGGKRGKAACTSGAECHSEGFAHPCLLRPAHGSLLVGALLVAGGCGDGGPISIGADAGSDGGGEGDCADDYALVFPEDEIVAFEIEMAPADWEAIVEEASLPMEEPAPEAYYPATVTFGGEVLEEVGVRSKGHGSRDPNKPALKLDFAEFVADQRFHCLKKINLNNMSGFTPDASMMRERLAYSLLRSAGALAGRVGYAEVAVNGEPFGLYVNVEQVDERYLADRLGESAGNLYKHYYGSYLDYRGPDPAAYLIPTWSGTIQLELKTNEEEADYTDIIHLMDVLTNTPGSQIDAALPPILDVDEAVDALGAFALLGCTDWYGSEGNNFYTYAQADGRFAFIPWDLDSCLRNLGQSVCDPTVAPGERPLTDSVLGSDELRSRYHGAVLDLIAGAYSDAAIQAEIDSVYALIAGAVHADAHKPISDAEFEAGVEELRGFFTAKRAQALADLESGCEGGGACECGGTPVCDVGCDDWCACYEPCWEESANDDTCTDWCNGQLCE
jgi:hypothetical protein